MKVLPSVKAIGFGGILAVLAAACVGCGSIPMYPPPNQAPPATAQSPRPPAGTPANPSSGSIDLLRVGDRLFITFSDLPQPMPPFEESIRSDGMITLPFNKSILAAGKSKGQLSEEIRALYVPGIYRNLTVTIKTEDRFFTVGGEVRNPNRFVYVGEMTVLKAIFTAGGFTEFANKRRVDVSRANGEKITVDAIRAQDDPRKDVPLYPGDQVTVRRRFF
jgi:polysaccharide export outer membrane protein